MLFKRGFIAIAVAVALVGPLTLNAARAASGDTTNYRTVQDITIVMSDGVKLSANAFIPTTGCPCPAILSQTPYRKTTSPNGFARHGYAELVVDVRGTGSSEGYWGTFNEREQRDGAEVVRWLAGQKWSNGKVGLYGGSYLAINQLLTAQQPGTEAIKAIFPIIPMSDAYRDVTWSGGAWDSSFMSWWYALVTGESAAPADYATSNPQVALNAESQHLIDVYGYTAQALAGDLLGAYQHSLCDASGGNAPTCAYKDAAYDGPLYRTPSPIHDIGKVTVPTFIVGGTYDIFQRGEPLLYRALNLPTTKKKLLIGPWYHVTAGNGLPSKDQNGTAIPNTDELALRWFDHWLKGRANGIESFPDVETYVLGKNKWVADSAFPMSGTEYENWYLSPQPSGSGARSLNDGSLAAARPAAPSSLTLPWMPANNACSRNTVQWTAGLTALAGSSGPMSQCENTNQQNEIQSLTFTTRPMTKAYTLSGPMNLHLYTSSLAADTSLGAVVTDVAPDGTSTVITGGSLVASLRAVDKSACGAKVEGCSLYEDGEIAIPWHPYTRASQSPLVANRIYDLQIEIFPTTAQVARGHRLRVSVISGDSPHRLDTASTLTGEANGAGLDTVYFGGGYPSRLYVGHSPLA